MWRYLQAAFWISPRVAGLGRLPLNAIGLGGFAVLGFGHAGFWLIGLGLEAAWLLAATSSERFQALVDAGAEMQEQGSTEDQRQALIAQLTPANRQRITELEKKSARALRLQSEHGVSAMMQELNADALSKLTWFYLKLLVACETLQTLGDTSMRRELQERVTKMQQELDGRVSSALRESKEATLKILRQRLAHVDRREESLAEIDSDLTRIEAQLDLAVDSAALRGKDAAVSTNIHFVSQFLDESVFGDASASIAALDESYNAPQPPVPRKVAE